MTHNKQNMFIELNISTSATFINDVSNYKPNKDNLIGCHNFLSTKNIQVYHLIIFKNIRII